MHSQSHIEALGQSEPFLAFQEQLSRAAAVDRPALLLGERGTGKELAAARLHYLSPRWEGAFVTLHCAALAPSLVESELFGHEAGAFTGATRQRRGRFEAADGGALFLDEVQSMPLPVQEKMLRAVEYGLFERVGGSRPVSVNVRVIAAANQDLPAMAQQGKFREDLLDRLAFEVLTLPPLREREGDVFLLAEHFARRMSSELGRTAAPAFSGRAREQLSQHRWPGNVRELKNTVERAVFHCAGDVIAELQLDPFASPFRLQNTPAADEAAARREPSPPEQEGRRAPDVPNLPTVLTQAVQDLEQRHLAAALEHAKYNQRRAAELLGMTYHQFRGLYRRHQKHRHSSGSS